MSIKVVNASFALSSNLLASKLAVNHANQLALFVYKFKNETD